ncbi:MAG: hypothetical protein GVY10_04755 [Verrucomicrobia bacterium]|jgi:CrcB protein|nr:hypothetical protein [Verrucomicrobiota bacterium]
MKPLLRFPDLLAIAAGGALGSLLRSWIALGYEGRFPVPTLMGNLLGAAALAVLYARQHRIRLQGRYLYMVGFCGSFTTVSAFSLELMQLLRSGSLVSGLAYLFSSIGGALLLVLVLVSRLEVPEPGREADR